MVSHGSGADSCRTDYDFTSTQECSSSTPGLDTGDPIDKRELLSGTGSRSWQESMSESFTHDWVPSQNPIALSGSFIDALEKFAMAGIGAMPNPIAKVGAGIR
jgi:hypothetical protein